MSGSMFQNLPAFAPFFDQEVAISGKRGTRTVRVTARACVIDSGFSDADTEAVANTDEHVYSVRILRDDWRDQTEPRIGDTVTDGFGKTARVTTVARDGGWYDLTCKTKGGAFNG